MRIAEQIPNLACLSILTYFGLVGLRDMMTSFQHQLQQRDVQVDTFASTLKSVNSDVLNVIKENTKIIGENNQIMTQLHTQVEVLQAERKQNEKKLPS